MNLIDPEKRECYKNLQALAVAMLLAVEREDIEMALDMGEEIAQIVETMKLALREWD